VNVADAALAQLPKGLEDLQLAFARRLFGQGSPPRRGRENRDTFDLTY
jgi:hypothetical protein